MDVSAYLARLGLAGRFKPTFETLRRIHVAHLYKVPFENLDIHLGKPIPLSVEAAYDKVVERRRGGFCYELNPLLGWLLGQLGFQVRLLSAGVAGKAGAFGPEFDHVLLEVQLGGPVWADVGFGEAFLEPLPVEVGREQKQGRDRFRIDPKGDRLVLVALSSKRKVEPIYSVSPVSRQLADFAERCRYHQTSPSSSFTRGRLASLTTPTGRVTLYKRRLITARGGRRTTQNLKSEARCAEVLAERFGIRLEDAPASALLG